MKYTIEIPDLDKLQRAFAKSPELVTREVTTAGNRSLTKLHASARTKAPVDTSQLRGGIQMRPMVRRGSSIEGKVEATAKHSLWQEEGTGIYGPAKAPIRPRRAKMLAFTVGGKNIFAKQVRGSKPKWYMRDSVKDNTPAVQREFGNAAERVVTALGRAL